MRRLGTIILLFFTIHLFAQKHPIAYAPKSDFQLIQKELPQNRLLRQSFNEIKTSVDEWVGKDIDVPIPKDPAGGYTHEKHKANYQLMFNSGLLYQITGEVKYALLVKTILLKYAKLNPTLVKHPEATSTSPGRIFWQALNDANWLVYTGLAYDCIVDYLTPAEKKQIVEGAFNPEVNYFTHDMKDWFNLIHNHAVWACAGVGIVGIATDNKEAIQMALYGSNKDGKAGLFAQLKGLFSPDGYYTEGPYYTRYAILPFYLFANALNNTQPELHIFSERNSILKKALDGALQQTNLNGGFYTYNDALKDKTYITSEMVSAINIAWQVYGENPAYLPIAKVQNKVLLSKGGIAIANALIKQKDAIAMFPYKSISFTDGAKGDEGGVSVMRSGKENQLTSLIFKYSSHGLSHGHFDKLNINLFDEGNEILQDYGAVRFIGIEQKWGGRYLTENKTYAHQTIAHNTIVVDEKSHFNGSEEESSKYHPNELFTSLGNNKVQVVSVIDTNAYKDIQLHRSIYMIQLSESSKPLIVDLFRTKGAEAHQYDLPYQYTGDFIAASFKYKSFNNSQKTLGTKNGYQHIWKEAEAVSSTPISQFTFLNHSRYYTISSLTEDSTHLFFTRVGANDPNFNLRRYAGFIIRKQAISPTFLNVIELHGNFNANMELSTNAYPSVKGMELLQNDDDFSIAKIKMDNKFLVIIQYNKASTPQTKHSVNIQGKSIEFQGNYTVIWDDKVL